MLENLLESTLAAALLSASTIEDGGVEVMPNVKFKSVIQRIETGSLIADGTCDFTASSNVNLTEVVIQPEEFQVNLQLCKSRFYQHLGVNSNGIFCI